MCFIPDFKVCYMFVLFQNRPQIISTFLFYQSCSNYNNISSFKTLLSYLCVLFQFLCIPQTVYCELVQLGQENIEFLTDESGTVVTVKEKRDDNGSKSGNILIRVHACLYLQFFEIWFDVLHVCNFVISTSVFIANSFAYNIRDKFQRLLCQFRSC